MKVPVICLFLCVVLTLIAIAIIHVATEPPEGYNDQDGPIIVLLHHGTSIPYSKTLEAPVNASAGVLLLLVGIVVVRDERGVIVEKIEPQGCAPYYVAHDRETGKSSFAFMDPDQAFDSLVEKE